jgi:hypothetical protein
MIVALHQRSSIWRVLLFACKEAWFRPPRGPWNMYEETLRNGMLSDRNVLVSDEVISTLHTHAQTRVHPWLSKADGVPVAKLWQIGALFMDSFYERHFSLEDDAPIIAAFFSQPLVELCLRIPSYLSVHDGVSRAMIRAAFADGLPEVVLRRSSKGSPEAWLRAMVERDAPFVREFLLEGVLVKERILDPRKLECALPGSISTRASHAGSVLNLLYTEAWLRAWAAPPCLTNPRSVATSSRLL